MNEVLHLLRALPPMPEGSVIIVRDLAMVELQQIIVGAGDVTVSLPTGQYYLELPGGTVLGPLSFVDPDDFEPAGAVAGHNSSVQHGTTAAEQVEIAKAHAHSNKPVIDKITEAAELPLWMGAAWPGGGGGGDSSDVVDWLRVVAVGGIIDPLHDVEGPVTALTFAGLAAVGSEGYIIDSLIVTHVAGGFTVRLYYDGDQNHLNYNASHSMNSATLSQASNHPGWMHMFSDIVGGASHSRTFIAMANGWRSRLSNYMVMKNTTTDIGTTANRHKTQVPGGVIGELNLVCESASYPIGVGSIFVLRKWAGL